MSTHQNIYRFGKWHVEPGLNSLSTNGIVAQLEPLAMDVLVCLLDRPGQLVAAETIMSRVWSNRNSEPHMVAKRISQIRSALGDSAKTPSYIATVSKRGYRTIAAVEQISGASSEVNNDSGQAARHRGYSSPAYSVDGAESVLKNREISIAVMPFDNLSGDTSKQYIADALTEEVITELSEQRHLKVMSRAAVMVYQGKTVGPEEVGKNLDVGVCLFGSVAHDENYYRINLQLVEASSGANIWAKSLEFNGDSGPQIRRDIAKEVVSHLGLALPAKTRRKYSTGKLVNEAAYDAYLLARSHMGPSEFYADWAPKTIEAANQAIALDPGYAEPWGLLALVETIKAAWMDRDHFAVVREYAEKALHLDSDLADGHAALGYVWLLYDWNLIAAEREFRKALAINPNHPWALLGYLNNMLVQERTFEVEESDRRMLSVSANDFPARAAHIRVLYNLRCYERVLFEEGSIRKLQPDYHSFAESASLWRLGRFDDSMQSLISAYQRAGRDYQKPLELIGQEYKKSDYESMFRRLAELDVQEHERGAYWYYAQIGEMDAAFECLETQLEKRTPWMIGLGYHPDFDVFRLDKRFDRVLMRTGLPELTENPARIAEVGRIMIFRGSPEKGRELVGRALKSAQGDARLYRWQESMAWACFATSEIDRALYWIDEAFQNSPNSHTRTFLTLLKAACYVSSGRLELAQMEISQAREIWPAGSIEMGRDLLPFFMGGDHALRDSYVEALQVAGL